MHSGESKETESALDKLEQELADEERKIEYTAGNLLVDVPELVPEEDDPNILFKNNWLSYGQSFLLTSSSGVGKSSMVVQMAYHWVMGRQFVATPLRALKIAIIQAEDSERDVAEQRHGMRTGLAAQKWSAEDINEAESRILMPGRLFIGLTSDKFAAKLSDMQNALKLDLIIINPAQSFFGGDVADQEATSHFCRELLDPIMKNPKAPCCIGVVTHTPKQKSGTKDGKSNVDDYGEYITAGSHEWTDWARAVLVFMKHGQTDGLFDFRGAKRGKRLGWKDSTGKATTKKTMKHADGFIFWIEASDGEGEAGAVAMSVADRERIARERKEHDKGLEANVWHLVQRCDAAWGTTHQCYDSNTIREYARKWWSHSVADRAVYEFVKSITRFGMASRLVQRGACKVSEYYRPEWVSNDVNEDDF